MPIQLGRIGVCSLCSAMCLWSLLLAPVQATEPKPPSDCRVDLKVIERGPPRLTVRLRNACPMSREQLSSALAELKPSTFADAARPQELHVDLGRVLGYPWLSMALAKSSLNSKEWDRKAGKPRQRNINQYVSALLRVSGVVDGLVPGWTLQAVSVEKVLVQPVTKMTALGASSADKSLVPFDAILWLRLASDSTRREEAGAEPPAVIPPAKLDE